MIYLNVTTSSAYTILRNIINPNIIRLVCKLRITIYFNIYLDMSIIGLFMINITDFLE